MSKLLPITITSIILAWLSQHVTVRRRRLDGTWPKDRLFFTILVICMILFAGLRTSYNDTSPSIISYNSIVSLNIRHIDWRLGSNPGYTVTRRVMKHIGFSAQTYILLFSAFTVGIFLWFVRKYSTNFVFSVFLLFSTGCYVFTFAAIKQCVAIAFSLLAVDRYLCKRYIRYVLYLLLGMLFHPYALMFFLLPLLCFRPWGKSTWLLLAGFIAAGFALQPLLGPVIDVTTMLGEEFDANTFMGEGVNPFRLAVAAVPVALSFLTRRVIWEEDNRQQNLFLNLTMLNAAILFVGLFGTANYFGRLASYFLVFQSISLPWLISHFETKSRHLVSCLALLCFSIYFVYAYAISISFDYAYESTTLLQYLRSILSF